MTLETLSYILLGVAGFAWIAYRQLSWGAVGVRMWTMPVVLAVAGLASLARERTGTISASDLALLVLELALSVGVGVVMGVLARFRPISEATLARVRAKARRTAESEPTLETSTGWLGFSLWIVLIAARIGIDVWASSAGSILSTTGIILLMVAANRAARVLVITQRVARRVPVAA